MIPTSLWIFLSLSSNLILQGRISFTAVELLLHMVYVPSKKGTVNVGGRDVYLISLTVN